MKLWQPFRGLVCIGAVTVFGAVTLVPDYWLGASGMAQARGDDDEDEDEMEYEEDEDDDDDRPVRKFFRNLGQELERQQQMQQHQQFRPNQNPFQPNFPNSQPNGRQRHWLEDVIQGLDNLESNEDKFEREEERLDRLWERGKISDEKYERLLDAAAKRLGVEDYEYNNYDLGWEQRNNQWQQAQQNANLNVEQKKLGLEYVKYGDRPLESDKGLVPKPNPVLGTPQAYDGTAATRLASAILTRIQDDVAGLQKSLPVGCRVADAVALIGKLKANGSEQNLVQNLQAALVDRDIRRFERNAQALLVSEQEVERLLIGITLENLLDKLEDKANADQITAITEPMVRRVSQAGLDDEFSAAFSEWLQHVPELLQVRQKLQSGQSVTAWPEGEVALVFDPQLSDGESRLLPGGVLATSGAGTSRVVLGNGNKFTANGLSLLKGSAATTAVDAGTATKPEVPKLLLKYPTAGGGAVSYTIICYVDQPTQVAGRFQPVEAWRQDYSINAGSSQPLSLDWNGRKWYEIHCRGRDGSAAKVYSLKPGAGQSPTYEFKVAGNSVSLVSTYSRITLDNSHNSRPFQFMLGNEYQTIRAGAKSTFDSGVTLRYARNGKTATPKAANGQAVAGATAESTDISVVTLRGEETGVIGLNGAGDWEIRPEAEVLVAERKEINLPVAYDAKSEPIQQVGYTPAIASRGTLYVLAVGVSKYKNATQFPALSFADKDAAVLADILLKQKKELFQDVQVTILKNEQATAFKVRTELVGLEKKATKNDSVALIFTGHGVVEKGAYYFCPHDTDSVKLARQGISCNELQKVTDSLSARNVFVFLDSCYSGGAADKLQEGFRNQVTRVGNSGVVIFASSKGTESSQEDRTWGHGALTKAFLDAIENPELDENHDSLLQVAELDRGLTEGVKKLTGGGQHLQSAELGNSIRNLSLIRLGR